MSKRSRILSPADLPSFLAGADIIIASDEAGLGAWAGGIVVSVVSAPKDWVPTVPILTDSKNMTPEERSLARDALWADGRIRWATLYADSKEVDAGNVYKVNVRLHTELIAIHLRHAPIIWPGKKAVAIVDGIMDIPGAHSLPKADLRVMACSAASVLSKVARDTMMVSEAREYPGYSFDKAMGYGTPAHRDGIKRQGLCPIHRRSFAPIAAFARKERGEDILELLQHLQDKD